MINIAHAIVRQIRRLWPISMILFACTRLVACDVTPNDGAAEPKVMCDIIKDGQTAYTIVRPDEADDEIAQAVTVLWSTIQDRYGIDIALVTDCASDNQENHTVTSDNTVKEILIGNTNRAESRSVNTEQVAYGYLIQEKNGKIVIWGSDAQQTVLAVHYFAEHILTESAAAIEENYLYVNDLGASDTPSWILASQFKIVYPTALTSRIREPLYSLCSLFGDISGTKPKPVTDRKAADSKEILIGLTNRPASIEAEADLQYMDYRVKVTEDQVVIIGGSALSTISAIEHFSDAIKNHKLTSLEEGYEYHYNFHDMYLTDSPVYTADTFVPVWADKFSVPEWMTDFEEKLYTLTTSSGRFASVAHMGGDIQNYPWDSLEAIQSAIMLGVDAIEMNLRLTKDNILVLMHDPNLKRTTNFHAMKGKNGLPTSPNIADWTYAELQQLNLVFHDQVTDYKIPTAYEAVLLCKNHTQILFDIKDDAIDDDLDIYMLAEELGAKQCFFAWRGNMTFVDNWAKRNPEDTEFAQLVETMSEYLSRPDHSLRVRSFTKFKTYGDGVTGWNDQFQNGAKLIFTDNIFEMSRYIAENQKPSY